MVIQKGERCLTLQTDGAAPEAVEAFLYFNTENREVLVVVPSSSSQLRNGQLILQGERSLGVQPFRKSTDNTARLSAQVVHEARPMIVPLPLGVDAASRGE